LATSFNLQSHHQAILNRIDIGTYINTVSVTEMKTEISTLMFF